MYCMQNDHPYAYTHLIDEDREIKVPEFGRDDEANSVSSSKAENYSKGTFINSTLMEYKSDFFDFYSEIF